MEGFSMLWIWVMVMAVFLIAELLTGGFFMLPFAVGGAVALIAELLGAPLWLQIAIFLVASIIALFLFRPFAHRVTVDEPQRSGIDRLDNKEGVVTQTIRTGDRGRVRIDREEWNATAPDAKADIAVGSHVRVLGVDGTHVIVEPLLRDDETQTDADAQTDADETKDDDAR